jgi:hypothetical protein
MVFGFLTNTVREEFEGLVNLLVAVLLREVFFHSIKYVEELKQAVETADDLDLKEAFLV